MRELYVKTRHLLEQGEILDGVAVQRRAGLRELLGAETADRYLDGFPAGYPLTFDAETTRMIAANRANWDARAPIHRASAFYGLDGSRPADSWFADYEWTDLGDLRGAEPMLTDVTLPIWRCSIAVYSH